MSGPVAWTTPTRKRTASVPIGDFAIADCVLAVLVLVSAAFGLGRGLVKEVLSLAIWIAALLSALAFAAPLGRMILDADPKLQLAVGFALVFVGVLVAGALLQRLMRALVETTGLSGTDRVLGLAFGTLRGAVVALFGLIALRPFAEERDWWQQSRLAPQLMAFEEDAIGIATALASAFGSATEALPLERVEEAVAEAEDAAANLPAPR